MQYIVVIVLATVLTMVAAIVGLVQMDENAAAKECVRQNFDDKTCQTYMGLLKFSAYLLPIMIMGICVSVCART
jgi:ABC-type uncharacterized transport system permease subunit